VPVGNKEHRFERLIIGVQLTLGGQRQPLADPLNESFGGPTGLLVAIWLLVQAQVARDLLDAEVQVRNLREIRTQCQHEWRCYIIGSKDDGQAFSGTDIMHGNLRPFDFDFEYNDVVMTVSPTLNEGPVNRVLVSQCGGKCARLRQQKIVP
jgi:hypothetical protein